MEFMTADLWVLAALTVLCSAAVACFGISEAQRFTTPRPAPRHRRRMSTLEVFAMGRSFIEAVGWVGVALIALAVTSFPVVVRVLHWLDARRERRFWGGQAVHS